MIVVLSGPSGVGKNTVGERMLAAMPEMTRVVTATTREPRGQERDGVDYHFWSASEFERAIGRGLLLEFADVLGKHYGTPLVPVVKALAAGKIVLLIIDVVGARQVKQMVPEALMVFLEAPDDTELEQRLRGRGTESEERVQRRLERARKEREALGEYDAVVVNDDVGRCADEVIHLVRSRWSGAAGSEAWRDALARLRTKTESAGL